MRVTENKLRRVIREEIRLLSERYDNEPLDTMTFVGADAIIDWEAYNNE